MPPPFQPSLFGRLKAALSKTRSAFKERLVSLFKGSVDEVKQSELEELFFEADLGAELSLALAERLKKHLRGKVDEAVVEREICTFLEESLAKPQEIAAGDPQVIFLIGINGAGKTTSLAKLAKHYKDAGKSVVIAAGDTFRAAASEQLTHWAERAGVAIVKGASDPAAVIYDAVESAKAKGADIVLVDTAGRLQNKEHLMKELEKMVRVAGKKCPGAPHAVWLVVDATLGQNSVASAEAFARSAQVTGLIVTKIDGSSKGGAAIAISHKLGLPITFVGVGEGIDDLEPFDAKAFTEALLQ